MKVLIIEDEVELLEMLKSRLTRAGMTVECADNADEGEWLWQEYAYDAVVLDLGLPGRNGLTLLQARRQAGDDTPVLILTARNLWEERVAGLKAGADDYLGKPFHFEELQARLEALMRRRLGSASNVLRVGNVLLDMDRHTVQVGKQVHHLSGMEFRVLSLLMGHPGRIHSREQILEHLYPHEAERTSGVVEVYVHSLRKLLGRERIVNVRGQGYYFHEEEAQATETGPERAE